MEIDLPAFVRGKLAEAEQHLKAREDMVRSCEHKMTPAEWRAAMNLHPSTRGTPMPTDEERARDAARQRTIAEKYRADVQAYRGLLALLVDHE